MTEFFSLFFVFTGSLFMLIAAIGINNMPDALCRAHALSKGLTLGICLMLLALLIDLRTVDTGTKITLAILFQIVTIPVAGHIFALFAYMEKK